MAGQSAKRASRIIQDRASKFIKVQRGPKWKRELVPDHKFDFIDVDEFRQHSCYNYFRYLVLYILIIISTASYIADLWSAGILLIYNRWSLVQEPLVPFKYSKWIFVGCIALSFLLLAWDIYKARSVVASRDISLAVTNNMAYRYYSVRSYSRFCLFRKINDSRKTSDFLAFFVFYTLKGWKKLLFAQGPRQIIAGVTVYVLLKTLWTNKTGGFQFSDDWDAYGDWPQRIALVSMSFTCLIWIFAMIELITACILYIPVFMKIQGNLKEYCCHKIDKRISELLEKQRKKRIREQEKRMQKMKKNGKKDPEAASTKLAEPTVPSIEPFDIYDDTRPLRTAAAAPAYNYSANDYAASEYSRFAPMTPYSEPAIPTQPFSPAPPRRAYTDTSYASDPYYHQYASPAPSLPRQPYYEDPGSYFEMQQYHPPLSPNAQHYPPSPSPRQQHATRQYSPQPSPRQQHTSPAPYYAHQAAGPAPGNYF